MSENKNLSRRAFLRATAVMAAAAAVQACAPAEEPTPEPTQAPAATATQAPAAQPTTPPATPTPEQMTYKESPMLAALVQQGQLPPVEERLPPDPEIVNVVEEIGQYGGTMRVAIGNVNQLFGDPQGVMGTELVLRIDTDFASVTGGLYESWEFNSDGTEQILYLRKGLKWSDGEPMTTADSLFDYVDCQLNEDWYQNGPSTAWTTGADKTPMQMEALDDYTLKLTFAEPNPLIILQQCFYAGCQSGGMFAPKHYLQQFHPKYTPKEELDAKVAAAGFERWTELIGDKRRVGSTIPAQVDLPGMTAFIRVADDPDHHTYERNPYYWKVDSEPRFNTWQDLIQGSASMRRR